MTQADQWGHWRPQFQPGEETKRVRAWYRRVACPSCSAAIGRVCRSAAGHPTDHHRSRRDAAGPLPYEEWRKEGLFQTPRPRTRPSILEDSHKARGRFNIDEPLGDAVAIVSQVLADRLGIGLGDDTTIDRLDDAARTLVLARGPIGSADLVTVLAVQVGILAGVIAGRHSTPETVNHGRLAEHGTHDELIAARGRYAAMFDAQAAQYAPTASIPNPAAPTAADPV
ncbi:MULTISPECIES: hypothetical protein [unclassified Streptomyces]|uniref:zinc finger domain-containing protein n=1 Tax=unclassified Streptomyces TaxID=2593676 RepID=UPI00225AD0DB|nr:MULTISPECIES: hypothetical protein [unclassified Streptomyces]MCX4403745.1 hypothetical protein [Streptomyces sp. NBC_01764]MCX5181305.1 hypothetical protein [Streptomyces sp. NBC_00268]